MACQDRARNTLRACTKAWLAVAMVLASSCSSSRAPSRATTPPPPRIEEQGLASWYGNPYHGRLTASGETYDMWRLTAAHRTLPFGSRVRVVNLDNGREVRVVITDRGPFVEGRIIDLSLAAARDIGADVAGVVAVRLVVEKVGDGMAATPCWEVQVGAFGVAANVEHAREQLRRRGYATRTMPAGDGLTRVRLTGFGNRHEAETAAREVRDQFPGASPVPCGGSG